MRNIYYSLLFICFFAASAKGQDPLFVQYYGAPNTVNPSLTGLYDGQFKAYTSYRNQYSSVLRSNAFETVNAGFDMRHKIGRTDFLGTAIAITQDNAGVSNFSQFRSQVSVAYHKQLTGGRYSSQKQYLIGGFAAGVGQNRISPSKLWFSTQFDSNLNQPDFTVSNGETTLSQSTPLFLDFSAGLTWYALLGNNTSLFAGAAMHHINNPEISFLQGVNTPLTRRLSFNLGGEIGLTEELSLLPGVMVNVQNPSLSILSGANFRYSNHDWQEVAIRMGVWTHLSNKLNGGTNLNALVIASILEVERWQIGISYDVSTGLVGVPTDARGAFELNLQYTHPFSSRYKTVCPKL